MICEIRKYPLYKISLWELYTKYNDLHNNSEQAFRHIDQINKLVCCEYFTQNLNSTSTCRPILNTDMFRYPKWHVTPF